MVLANFGDEEEVVNVVGEFERIPSMAIVHSRSGGFVPENILVGYMIILKYYAIFINLLYFEIFWF